MKNNESNKANPRRGLLKSLAVGGIAANMLPSQWVKPIVDVALLPAHAQMSTGMDDDDGMGGEPTPLPACDVDCSSIEVNLSWPSSASADLDLEMETPGGTRIAPKGANGVLTGRCGLQHQGDANGNEQVEGGGSIAAGRYRVFVRNSGGTYGGSYFVSIAFCGGIDSGSFGTLESGVVRTVGSINLSSGGTASVRVGLT